METPQPNHQQNPPTTTERDEIGKALIAGAKRVNRFYLEESEAWYPLEEEVANFVNTEHNPS